MYDLHDFLTAVPIHELNDDKGYTDGQLAKHIAVYNTELPVGISFIIIQFMSGDGC